MRKAWVRASLLTLAVSVPAAAGAADYARTLAYEQTVAGITAMVVAGGSAHDLQAAAAPLGLTLASSRREAPALPQLSAAHVSLVAIDLVLSQLALQAGANYHVALRQAQDRPEVLLLDAGVTSLASLYQAVTAAGLTGVLDKTDDGYVLHVPLAVWNDATLSLQPGETLLIDRSTGAFVVAAGMLSGTDAAIRSTGDENPRLKDFNPFVVVALSGSAQFDRMRFSDLGYGIFAPLTGVTLVEGGFYRKGTPSHISDSVFDDVGSLALVDAENATVDGNVFQNSSGPAVLISGGKSVAMSGNVILAGPAAHGIKVTAGAREIQIVDNIVVGAGLNGIFADSGASDLLISNNLISSSHRSGVSVASADCIIVGRNLLLKNAQSGLAVRDSAGLQVVGNRLIDNGNAGISVTHQPDYGVIAIASNELDGNQVGIKGSTTARLSFAANDFSAQAPRLLDGELVQFTDKFLNLKGRGGAPTVIDGLDLKSTPKLTPSGALRPTSCSFPGDA